MAAAEVQPLQDNEIQINATLEAEVKQLNSEIRKCLEKMNTNEDTKALRAEIAYCYYKRGVVRLDRFKNFVGSVYDLTLSLQYNVTPFCFYKRGELFLKLAFYEQALADFQSSYEYSTVQKDKEVLLLRIVKLKEIVEQFQQN